MWFTFCKRTSILLFRFFSPNWSLLSINSLFSLCNFFQSHGYIGCCLGNASCVLLSILAPVMKETPLPPWVTSSGQFSSSVWEPSNWFTVQPAEQNALYESIRKSFQGETCLRSPSSSCRVPALQGITAHPQRIASSPACQGQRQNIQQRQWEEEEAHRSDIFSRQTPYPAFRLLRMRSLYKKSEENSWYFVVQEKSYLQKNKIQV